MAVTVAATRYLPNRAYASVEFTNAKAVSCVMEQEVVKVLGHKVVVSPIRSTWF
jgi:hypothetical protein